MQLHRWLIRSGEMQDAQLSLVHIPLTQYHQYLQCILKLLFPLPTASIQPHNGTHDGHSNTDESRTSWANHHRFLNVSITPVECSIVCSKGLARQIFGSGSSQAPEVGSPDSRRATISSEDFVVISVEGEGLEAGQRVLELTTPLALAGMYVSRVVASRAEHS